MGLKHKVLILHYLSLSRPEGTPMWSPTLKAKEVHSIYSRFFKFMFKGLEKKFHWDTWPTITWGNN